MSAGAAVQAALVAALGQEGELSGVYDGPPARAAYPYAVIDAGSEVDWSHKTGIGREVMVALTLWDDAPARLAELSDRVEAAAAGIVVADGWALASMRFLKRRTVRDVAGPWATAVDFRARVLAV